ncbi:T9SS type A sorting domain-containing protein [Polaribacter vadi]|uniref:T9SS type A sorting domain-containing protein n=1 Tax=Polaribacter TaxID=52959 RepID=UPI001C082DA6|nr:MULTISPECIES: T9SS type A sorting domain-containing protein [Polaribacter]MBU3011375.1 T9SS type A sorting domain-containing protein [Polaribacter vadi]MDO6741187.1 T9SS type A sorting domain-containing protein [Polaribacter sp. 1_MG-2023]
MKKNYMLKTIKTSIAIFAILLGFSQVNAQTATAYPTDLKPIVSTVYATGAITVVSDEIALEGTTFKIQATITPASTAVDPFIESNATSVWGVNNAQFNGQLAESAVINSISIVDFNANGTDYSDSAISNLHFSGISFSGAQGHARDNVGIVVDGANAGSFETGKTAVSDTTITFGTEYFNAASTEAGSTPGTGITVGSAGDVTSITVNSGTESTSFRNAWSVVNIIATYTFTTSATASLEEVKNDALSIYPTLVDDTFSVNKAFETLQLFDLTGKTVKTFNSSDILEVSGLNKGLYIVKIQSATGGISTSKMIVK